MRWNSKINVLVSVLFEVFSLLNKTGQLSSQSMQLHGAVKVYEKIIISFNKNG